MLSSLEKKTFSGLTIALGLLILIGMVSLLCIQELIDTTNEVRKLQSSVEKLEETISHLKDAETGTRGFVITGQSYFLDPYQAALILLKQDLDILQHTLQAPENQYTNLPKLQTIVKQKMDVALNVIKLRQSRGIEAVSASLLLHDGKALMDQTRLLIMEMKAEERALLTQREQQKQQTITLTTIIIVGGSLTAIFTVFLAILFIKKDTTKRIEAETKLLKSEQMLKHSQQLARIGSWEYTLADAQLVVSEETYLLYELEPNTQHKITADHLFRFVHPEDIPLVQYKFETCLLTGQSYEVEYRLLPQSGEQKCMLTIGHAEQGPDGNVWKVVGTIQDITQRKLYEAALYKSEARFSSIFRLNPFPTIIARLADGKILDANQQALKVFGYTYEEVINSTATRLNIWVDPDQREALLDRLKIEKAVYELDTSYFNKAGQLWHALSSFEVIDLDGEECLLTIIQDVTKRKYTEESIKAYSQELEKLNASKDKFFYIIAHDLMSPVNGIIGSANVMASHTESLNRQEIREFAEAIYTSTMHLKNLLQSLLDWARTQSEEIPFNPVPINLRELAMNVVSLLKDNIQKKEIDLKITLSNECKVEADQNMILSVLNNLIANAVKFSRIGGSIQLSGQLFSSHVQVNVSDTGMGMSKAVQEQLFQIGSKHTTLGTAGEKGTGLGLLLCKEFVERHGGNIWVESEEGKRTTFSFTLPR